MYYKISSIMFNNTQKASNASEVFIAQPDEHKESLAGRLFILLEIESHKSKALKIANFLVNSINYNYYQSEKILLREQISNLKVEHIFETALANVNKDLVEFLNQEKIKISPHAFNVTAGVIHENYLYLSSVGKNKNLLIYPDPNGEYKISDIGEGQKNSSPALTKIFSDVISGPLPEEGYFFLANEALTEHLSGKQMIEAVTKLPPTGAASYIQNIVSQINVPVNFLGVIVKNTTKTQETQQEEDKKSSSSHLFDIDETKNQTEEIMKPAGAINLKNLTQKLSSSRKKEEQPSTKKKTSVKKKNYYIHL